MPVVPVVDPVSLKGIINGGSASTDALMVVDSGTPGPAFMPSRIHRFNAKTGAYLGSFAAGTFSNFGSGEQSITINSITKAVTVRDLDATGTCRAYQFSGSNSALLQVVNLNGKCQGQFAYALDKLYAAPYSATDTTPSPTQIFTTLASPTGTLAPASRFYGLAGDRLNLYQADTLAGMLRRFNTNGSITETPLGTSGEWVLSCIGARVAGVLNNYDNPITGAVETDSLIRLWTYPPGGGQPSAVTINATQIQGMKNLRGVALVGSKEVHVIGYVGSSVRLMAFSLTGDWLRTYSHPDVASPSGMVSYNIPGQSGSSVSP